jgi:hypothetical protein
VFCRPLSFALALAVAGLASAGLAEPTAQECDEAAEIFSEMLNAKVESNSKGIGWVLYPPSVDYYSLAPEDQWRELVRRFGNMGQGYTFNLRNGKKWHDGINPDFRGVWAKSFLMNDTLELCLRPLALASSPKMKNEIADFDTKLPPDVRAILRDQMKASQ